MKVLFPSEGLPGSTLMVNFRGIFSCRLSTDANCCVDVVIYGGYERLMVLEELVSLDPLGLLGDSVDLNSPEISPE